MQSVVKGVSILSMLTLLFCTITQNFLWKILEFIGKSFKCQFIFKTVKLSLSDKALQLMLQSCSFNISINVLCVGDPKT